MIGLFRQVFKHFLIRYIIFIVVKVYILFALRLLSVI
jgi:hypothetical protein